MNNEKTSNNLKIHLYFFPFVFLLFITAYYSTLQWMCERYMSPDSYYSHGFLIPFVTLYLIWKKKDRFKVVQKKPSLWGLVIILFAALLHIFGTIIYIFSVSGFSIYLFIVGCTLFLFGKEITKIAGFPLLFLLFMFPVPIAFINMISFPLKILAADYGVKLVELSGIPVLREGFNITIPQGTLLVGNPCSGLRSLIAFLALSSLLGYLGNLPTARKWILFFLTVPIALISNLIRVPTLILWSYKYGLAAAAPDTIVHTMSGLAVFIFGIILLYFLMYCLKVTNEE